MFMWHRFVCLWVVFFMHCSFKMNGISVYLHLCLWVVEYPGRENVTPVVGCLKDIKIFCGSDRSSKGNNSLPNCNWSSFQFQDSFFHIITIIITVYLRLLSTNFIGICEPFLEQIPFFSLCSSDLLEVLVFESQQKSYFLLKSSTFSYNFSLCFY